MEEAAPALEIVEEEAILSLLVRIEIARECPIPKSLVNFFPADLAMASASDQERNTICEGQRSRLDMEVHTLSFQPSAGKDEKQGAAAAAVADLPMVVDDGRVESRGDDDDAAGNGGDDVRDDAMPQLEELSLEAKMSAAGSRPAKETGIPGGLFDGFDDQAATGSQTVDFPPKQSFVAGNPLIEVTKGLVHLYTPSRSKASRHMMVCLLAIPAEIICSELMTYMSPFGGYIKSVRIIRDSTPNQYMALVDFFTEARANEFYKYYHGRPFNMLEPAVCTVAFVSKLEVLKTEQGASLPASGATEIPNCPVCLERMDVSILTALCNHRFHSQCMAPVSDNRCPLCRYVLSPESVGDHRCMDCDSAESIWMCLICGHVGCGRYVDGHANKHFLATQHTFAKDVANNRVWDYAGDNFVHRLVQSSTGNKLVEVQAPSHASKGEVSSTEKWESLKLEYTFLLTNQLESQRLFFEEKVKVATEEMQQEVLKAQHRCRELEARVGEMQQEAVAVARTRCTQEKKCASASERLAEATKQLAEEKEMNQFLRANQQDSQQQLEKADKAAKEELAAKDKEIQDLREQLRDVMFYIGAQKEVESMGDTVDKEALQAGQVTVGAAAKVTTPHRSQRKKRR